MKPTTTNTLTAYALLCVAGGASLLMPEEGLVRGAAAQDADGSTVRITGTLFDFRREHPDFGITLTSGHRANLVDLILGGTTRPTYLPNMGYEVGTQWNDRHANAIPPHLFLGNSSMASNAVAESLPQISNNPTVDTYDSSVGPYGGDNVGPAPEWDIVSSVEDVAPPSGLPYTEIYLIDGGTHTLSSSMECKEFNVKQRSTLQVSGDVVVRVNEKFDVQNNSRITLMPGATLTLWIGKDFQVHNHGYINENTANPDQCTIYYWSDNSNTFKLDNYAKVHAHFVSPNADLIMGNNCDLFGTYTGKQLKLTNSAGYHHDGLGGGAGSVCSVKAEDVAGTSAGQCDAGIYSVASFDTWFRNALGLNLSYPHTIELSHVGGGVYEFEDTSFHPIDGMLYGNDGQSHNNYFTFTFTVDFEFEACAGLFFEFEGNDDAWAFFGDDLGLDLGGVRAETSQYVELDRLPLEDGQTYKLRFFYAHRAGTTPSFRVRTNLDFIVDTPPQAVTAAFD